MSQTNINTNTGVGNNNRKYNARRGGRGQGEHGSRGQGGRGSNRGNNSIDEYSFERKMRDGCLSKLTITKNGHRATQYKKVIDVLPVFCADKYYR